MSYPLGVVTPEVGVLSQTFIRRHVQDLLPGRTAVLTRLVHRPGYAAWSVEGPVLQLHGLRPGLVRRGVEAGVRRVGWQLRDHRTHEAKRFLRRNGVQVVLGEHLDMPFEWLGVAAELGIRFFGHAHGYDVSTRLRDPEWRARYLRYNEAAGVITVSRASRQRLIALGIEAAKIHVVPCGVHVPADAPRRPRRGTVRCLAVGRMVGKKAPICLVDSFRRAQEARPDLHLDVIGTGSLLPAVQQYIRAFHLESAVTLHGAQPHDVVLRMMRDADVLLQHSMTSPTNGDEEGLPVAILEGMAHGLPVVSTRHAGIPEAVDEGATGYLVEEGDTAAMGERIAQLADDPDRRGSMGTAGWRRALELYSWETERSRLREILGLEQWAAA